MCFRHNIYMVLVSGILCLLCILSVSKNLWGATEVLNEEAVFSLYCFFDSKGLKQQDLEDFCYRSGKANFTSFKPSEMFMKHGLNNLLTGIKKRIEDFDEETLFSWRVKGKLMPVDNDQANFRIVLYDKRMPQPTPYINSDISKNGFRTMEKMLDSLVSKEHSLNKKKELDIVFSLMPEGVEYRFQNRNIAFEDVLLPIRYVIFNPVKVEVSDN